MSCEPYGAQVFLNTDVRNGCHQLRMREGNEVRIKDQARLIQLDDDAFKTKYHFSVILPSYTP
ncbi:hypothetical protein HanIR_Chr01g0028191 [Helianthus annuus]|nr:hypothetical protein HanIR_Chr01g0028191 [Helianthus annuus]